MSSTTTTWSTDTNTKSGSATTYTDTVSSLRLVGGEGEDAILRLFADEGDDNADQWRIVSQASNNKLNIMSYASGSWSNVMSLFGSGTAASVYAALPAASKLFLDGAGGTTYLQESSDGHLEINSGTTLDMTAPTVDINSSTELNIDTAAYDLNASGAVTLNGTTIDIDGSGAMTFNSSGGTIGIGNDAVAQAINIGTGAAARVITMGNVTGATQVVLNAGTAGIALASTGAGDITIDSDDTLLLDSDGILELNSSAGVISIGNDDIDQNINIGTQGERTINIGTGSFADEIVIGNTTGASGVHLLAGTGDVQVTGNLGIGTASPTALLDIKNTAAFSTAYNSTAHNILLKRSTAAADDNYGGSIGFSQLGTTYGEVQASIAMVQTESDINRCGLAFFTHPTDTGSDAIVEKMRIDSTGYVGIGTDTPNTIFHIDHASQPVIQLTRTAGHSSATVGEIQFGSGSNPTDTSLANIVANGDGDTDSAKLSFGTQATSGSNTTKMTIKSTGNIGMGIITPPNPLSVSPSQYSTGTASQSSDTVTGSGTTFTAAMIGSQLVYADGTNGGTVLTYSSGTSITVSTSQTVSPAQSYIIHYQGIQVKSDGNVGIGTATPNANLVLQSSTSAAMQIIAGSGAYSASLQFWEDAGEDSPSDGHKISQDSNALNFRRANDTLAGTPAGAFQNPPTLCLQSDGNVGIGTENPEKKLTIEEENNPAEMNFNRDDDTIVADDVLGAIYGTGDDPTSGSFYPGAAIKFVADGTWGDDDTSDSPGRIEFFTTPNDSVTPVTRMRIDKDGNVGIGTASPSVPLHVEDTSESGYIGLFKNLGTSNNADCLRLIISGADGADHSSSVWLSCEDAAGAEYRIIGQADGDVEGGEVSDRRVKENIIDIPDGLGIISQLSPRRYNRKGIDSSRYIYGFIADEYSTVFPYSVQGEPNATKVDEDTGETVPDYQFMSNKNLFGVMVKAIQELSAKVTALENK